MGHVVIASMLAFDFIWTWPIGWVIGVDWAHTPVSAEDPLAPFGRR